MFLSLIQNRRSIRKYTGQPVEPEKIEKIVEAALRAPSSRGLNPWEFVVIDDKALLEKMATSKPHGSSFLKNAPLGIIVTADDAIDTWVEDCSIAATFVKLAAESLGLKSCWVQIRDRKHDESSSARDFVAELTGLPENLNVLAIIAIGYAAEEKAPHGSDTLQYEKVKRNHYSHSFR